MKILDEVKSMTWKDAAWLIVLIVVLAPGVKAGATFVSGLVGYFAAAIK